MREKISTIRNFAGNHKRALILTAAAVLVAAGVLTAVFFIGKSKSSGAAPSYREYTVTKGDVTVGTTESGTVSLENSGISFPVDCKISSVLVKAGAEVKKGDPLVQLDLGSVADGSSDTNQKLEAAKGTLQQALSDQKTKLETAKITYESSKYLAQSAPVTRELTLGQIQNDISTAQAALAKDQKSLAEAQALQKSWPADDAKLQELEKWMNDAQATKTSYENQLTAFNDDNADVINQYNSFKTAADNAKADLLKAEYTGDDGNGNSEEECKTAYDNAKEIMNDYYSDTAGAVITQQNTLESKVSEYTAQLANYTSAYNDFKATYDEKYKQTGSELDDQVTSLQASVKTDQYNLDKAKKTADISSVDAQTKEETDLAAASSAEDAYDLTVSQLSQNVQAQQESYDKLQKQMDEINNAMNGDGVITSPCDGVVATVSYQAGASVAADQSMMLISQTGSVSLAISVSEDDITSVEVGEEASISLTAYEDQSFDATVESITAEPARSGSSSVSYTVTVKMNDGATVPGKIYTGMSGEATLIQKRVKDVLTVNNRAVTFENGVSSVLVRSSDGGTEKRTVKTGFSDGTSVEVESGLREGETVLAESAVSAG